MGCSSKPKLVGDGDTVPPPPGYPNLFPYNNKQWQEGKVFGGGMPVPPIRGGTPPPPMPGASPAPAPAATP